MDDQQSHRHGTDHEPQQHHRGCKLRDVLRHATKHQLSRAECKRCHLQPRHRPIVCGGWAFKCRHHQHHQRWQPDPVWRQHHKYRRRELQRPSHRPWLGHQHHHHQRQRQLQCPATWGRGDHRQEPDRQHWGWQRHLPRQRGKHITSARVSQQPHHQLHRTDHVRRNRRRRQPEH